MAKPEPAANWYKPIEWVTKTQLLGMWHSYSHQGIERRAKKSHMSQSIQNRTTAKNLANFSNYAAILRRETSRNT